MVRLITKTYPSLVDVYAKITEVNEETGEVINTWDYENPVTIPCNVTAINPQESLERFSADYEKKVFLKIEHPTDAVKLSDQAGNLRRKDEQVYYYGAPRAPMIFNVSGISTQVDILGNAVCHVSYLEYFGTYEI